MDSNSIRIAILGLNYSPEPTGNAPYTTSLAEGLKSLGYQVRVITAHPHYPEWAIRSGYGAWTSKESIRGVPVRRLRHWVPSKPVGLKRLLSEISFGVRVLFSRLGRPDVVLLVSPALFASALALVKIRISSPKTSVGLWVQDLYSLGITETQQGTDLIAKVMATIEARTLSSADGVVVIHDRFREYATAALGVAPDKIEVIRNWSHLQPHESGDRAAVRARLGWTDNETVVLHAGNQGLKQGLENLVDAARHSLERGLPIRFVLLGSGSQRSHIESLARGVTSVDFLDALPDDQFQDVLRSADVLVVNERPGLAEMAVPSKLTTYFSTGLPVIAVTDEGSITAHEIALSRGGVRVNTASPADLCKAVMEMRENKTFSKQLGENGLTFRREVLGSAAAISKYADWLLGLAKLRGRPGRASRFTNIGDK